MKTIQPNIRLVTGYPEKMAGYPANSVSGATLLKAAKNISVSKAHPSWPINVVLSVLFNS